MGTTSNFSLPYPDSTDAPNIPADLQALADKVDLMLSLPDPIGLGGSGQNTITLTTFSALPTTPISTNMTNPSSTHDMLCLVGISAFMASTSAATECQAALSATGGLSITAGSTGGNGILATGENLLTTVGSISSSNQFSSMIPVIIPAGAAAVTFAMFARRSNTSNACYLLNPAIRVIPIRFMIP